MLTSQQENKTKNREAMRKWASAYYANIRTRITLSCEKGKHRKVRPEVVHDAPSTRNVFTLSAPPGHGTRHRRFPLTFHAMPIFRGSSRLKADFVFCGTDRVWWVFNGDDSRFWSSATGLASSRVSSIVLDPIRTICLRQVLLLARHLITAFEPLSRLGDFITFFLRRKKSERPLGTKGRFKNY